MATALTMLAPISLVTGSRRQTLRDPISFVAGNWRDGMATSLKSMYGPEVVHRIGERLAHASRDFPKRRFLELALAGYDELELMDRGRHITAAMAEVLPKHYPSALEHILRAVDAPAKSPPTNSLSSFLYMPFTEFIARHGLDHVDLSLTAMHGLTQRFTAEFCIRPFLIHHPEATLIRLREFATDPSADVRRLVSEGTRPRLPWAPRLPEFQRDPTRTIALLELLRDDESEYVRRSVANHLNDIGKDHPDRLIVLMRRWLVDAPNPRRRVVRHALRSLLKAGHPEAMEIVGHAPDAQLEVRDPGIAPKRVARAGKVLLGYVVDNRGDEPVSVIADCRIGFVKADGSTSPKVFRLATFRLNPGQSREVSKSFSMADLSTRKHYPGRHLVEAQVNGQRVALGEFVLGQ